MLSVAREGRNERRGVDGRASLPSASACVLPLSRAHTLAGALASGFMRERLSASSDGVYRARVTLR
jgi:hypothetical protein